MNKKMLVLGLFIISVIGVLAVAKASETRLSFSQPNFTKTEVLEGVAFDKTTNETKQAAFLVMEYGSEKNIYLVIGNDVFKMEEIGNITKPEGTKIFFYKSDDGSVLTLLTQKFACGSSISGDFKNYLITFKKPCCYKFNSIPLQNPGLGKVHKEVRNETRMETRPVRGEWKSLTLRNREEVRNEERKTLRICNISL
ncbi:MAG: hypothetical protein QXQ77_00280 [Candidatus Aenigmatarchaeota archaeon]